MSGITWVTGAAGFSGRHMVALLTKRPDRPHVVGLDVAPGAPPGLDAYHTVDLNDMEKVADLARQDRPDRVIHLAAAMPPAADATMWRVNVGGTVNLLRALASARCDGVRVVSIGSAAEYLPQAEGAQTEDSPCGGASPYGRVKWAQTLVTLEAARRLDLDVIVARTFNLIGPGMSVHFVPGWLAQQFALPEPPEEIEIGNTKSARDFVDVRDAVAAYGLLADRGTTGEIYNVCSGRATRIQELIDLMSEVTGRSPRLRVDSSRLRASDASLSYGDHGKIGRATGWRPQLSLRESVGAMIETLGGRIVRSREDG